MDCPRCGFESPPAMRFCGRCGTPLEAASAMASGAGERRQLTVMFCDLVGSTELSDRLDPEDLAEVVGGYQDASAAVIRRHEGWVAQYLGDGILVYFGYPTARGDEARRAVSAGLEVLGSIERLNRRLSRRLGVEVAVRVGIHTGLVVIGAVGTGNRREELALGQAPNVAARVQAEAAPGELLISGATHRLVEGHFLTESVGRRQLKGVSESVELVRVDAAADRPAGGDGSDRPETIPMVGRRREMEALVDAWNWARAGECQVVAVQGEAGIGKSRLVKALHRHVGSQSHGWLAAHCSPQFENTPLYPVTELFTRLWNLEAPGPAGRGAGESGHAGGEGDDGTGAKGTRDGATAAEGPSPVSERLVAAARGAGLDPEVTVPLWASLFGLPGGPPPAPGPEAARRRRAAFDALIAWIEATAAARPTVLVVQNLHWVDPSTRELLDLLIERAPRHLLLLLTFRPSWESSWRRGHAPDPVTEIGLEPLAATDAAEMVGEITGGRELPPGVLEQIVAKADGIPLFLEEMTKMVLESGRLVERGGRFELSSPLPDLAIPTTLADSLTARLDRLGSVKAVAQLCATLGRDFHFGLLEAVSPSEPEELAEALDRLVAAELLYLRGGGSALGPDGERRGDAVFVFKHALIQDAAYSSLLRSRRQQYHRRIARVLEERFPEVVARSPELVAHHHAQAGTAERAVPLLLAAGRSAVERSAHREALVHLERGLELVKGLDEGGGERRLELALLTTQGPALMATKGFIAPELQRAYRRAYEICRELGRDGSEDPELFPVLWGLLRYYSARAEYPQALDLGQQMVRLAEGGDDPNGSLEAHRMLGSVLLTVGRFEAAREHLERALDLYDPSAAVPGSSLYLHPQVFCLFFHGQVLWYLGEPDRAREQMEEALAEAVRREHPFTETVAHFGLALVEFLRRQPDGALRHAETAARLAESGAIPQWGELARLLVGWGRVRAGGAGAVGDAEDARGAETADEAGDPVALIETQVERLRSQGVLSGTPLYLLILADALACVGRVEAAVARLEEALEQVERSGERMVEAEIHRLLGRLVRDRAEAQGEFGADSGADAERARRHLERAVEVARDLGAVELERRASRELEAGAPAP